MKDARAVSIVDTYGWLNVTHESPTKLDHRGGRSRGIQVDHVTLWVVALDSAEQFVVAVGEVVKRRAVGE